MCTLTFNSITGASPFDVFVSDVDGYYAPVNIGPIPSGATFPVTLSLPPYLTSAPSILIEIVDSSGCTDSTIIIPPGPPSTANLFALLFIEPISRSSEIYTYLSAQGNTTFFGFGYGTPPLNGTEFIEYMKMYATSGVTGLPPVFYQSVPQTTSGNDSFGNPNIAYNFTTTQVPAGTAIEDAWYTWVIPNSLINNQLQTEISYGNQNSPFILNGAIMNTNIDSYIFNYTGSTFANTFYRTYTTFPSTEFYLNNINVDIYFRGLTVQ
jgi:hypothetical protein